MQSEQDFVLASPMFPGLMCRAIAAQFMKDNLIALFGFELSESEVALDREVHFKMPQPDDLSVADMERYRTGASCGINGLG